MNKYEIHQRLEEINKELEKPFEKKVKEVLKAAEETFYGPYCDMGLEELQEEYLKVFLRFKEEERISLIEEAKKLSNLLDDMQFLEHLRNEIKNAEIKETTQSVVLKQIRINTIDIEKHYKVNKEYNVLDWLADADPENFLGFQ